MMYRVSYLDVMINMVRSRCFSNINDALEFIKVRVDQPTMYKIFTLEYIG